ncbi:glycoside hydrolase [Fimbriimonas ginsengisoli]|uniref:Uncharacterized protein n=1 Tax=Fimbriimonas ginsengisoli Gsoil 348 TaxID=661478 RepID=A0A068NND3_FIMGI|nr:glycoside hydrolase [Fimbriimonas ginsengisoli]AIE84971.1 hypothetical protein OP10G_1603 [Fimbriimonas ginsengisoli Gsoil 348]
MAGSLWMVALGLSVGTVARLENSELRVEVDPSSGEMAVLDKGTGQVWRQAKGARIPLTGPVSQSGGNLRFKSAGLKAQVEFTLPPRSRNLTVSIQADDPQAKIEPFDFFAPFQPEPGSFLTVADYNDGHLYPTDLDKWPLYNLDHIHVNALDMPWVGVVDLRSGRGYSLMVDTPFDATLKCLKTDGQRAPWVRWEAEKGSLGYARAVTYHFTAKGGYVDMAKAFRARTELGKLSTKARSNKNIPKLYGAPGLWDFNQLVSDREMKALGVDRCVHHVQDWSAHGDAVKAANALGYITEDYDYYLSSHPVSPDHPYLSGTSGRGYYDTLEHVAVAADGKPRGEGDWWIQCPSFYKTVGKEIIPKRLAKTPTTAIYFDQITADYLGVDDGPLGGGSLEECYDPKHPLGRREWSGAVRDFLKYVTDLEVIPAAEHGKWWEVPYTSIFYGIVSAQWPWPDVTFPTSEGDNEQWRYYRTWGSVGHTYRVPLWQLVYHDSAITMWYPWDVNDVTVGIPNDWIQEKKDAASVLYGVAAGFMVSDPGTGSWFKDRGKFMTSYRNTAKIHEALADKEMVSHRFLTPDRDVQETRWSDGTRVVVNFGSTKFLEGSYTIPRFGWIAKGPWGQAEKVWDDDAKRVVTTIVKGGYRFTDRSTWHGRAVAQAESTTGGVLRVNVDPIEGERLPVHLSVRPSTGLRVYVCDAKTGERTRRATWSPAAEGGINVEPLTGWIVLDVEQASRLRR